MYKCNNNGKKIHEGEGDILANGICNLILHV